MTADYQPLIWTDAYVHGLERRISALETALKLVLAELTILKQRLPDPYYTTISKATECICQVLENQS